MSQLYARVFLQILDSSIAEDFTTRHVFEDMLKLVDHKTGVIDITRQALARRINMPLDMLNLVITKLESEDLNSRDEEFNGRRIQRIDEHRDWGWIILNHAKYEAVRNQADLAMRVAAHRERKKILTASPELIAEIYNAYPRKIGRPGAFKAIARALTRVSHISLLKTTQAYARARADQDPTFTPHPATWFNQERYNDDPITWKRSTTVKPNPRNDGVAKAGPSYGDAARALQQRQRMVRQMDSTQHPKSPTAVGTGAGGV